MGVSCLNMCRILLFSPQFSLKGKSLLFHLLFAAGTRFSYNNGQVRGPQRRGKGVQGTLSLLLNALSHQLAVSFPNSWCGSERKGEGVLWFCSFRVLRWCCSRCSTAMGKSNILPLVVMCDQRFRGTEDTQ